MDPVELLPWSRLMSQIPVSISCILCKQGHHARRGLIHEKYEFARIAFEASVLTEGANAGSFQ